MVQISIRQVNVDANLEMGDHNVNNTDAVVLSSQDNQSKRTLTLGNNGSIYIDNKALLSIDYKLTPDCYPSALTLNTLGGIGAVGDGGKVLVVSSGGGGVSLVAASTVGTTRFTGLSDVESSYIANGFIVSNNSFDGLRNTRRVKANNLISITSGSDASYSTGYNDIDFVDTTTALVLRGQTAAHLLGGIVSIQGGWRFPIWTGLHNVAMPSTDGTAGQVLTTNGNGAITWASATAATFAGLGDVGTMSTNGAKFLRVNTAGTGIEYITLSTIPTLITTLTDVSSYPTAGSSPTPGILLYDNFITGAKKVIWITGVDNSYAEGVAEEQYFYNTTYHTPGIMTKIYSRMVEGLGKTLAYGSSLTSGVLSIGYDVAAKEVVYDFATQFLGANIANATTATPVSAITFGTNLSGTYNTSTGAMTINASSGSSNATSIGNVPVSTYAPHAGDILMFTGGFWTPSTPSTGGAYSPGNGISIVGGSLAVKLSTSNSLLSFNGNNLQSNGVKVTNGNLTGNFQTLNFDSSFTTFDSGGGTCSISSSGGGGGSATSIVTPNGTTSAASLISFQAGSGMTISASGNTVTFNSSGGVGPGTVITANADNQSVITANNNNSKSGTIGFFSNGQNIGFKAQSGNGFGAIGFLADSYSSGIRVQNCTTGITFSNTNGVHANYIPIPFTTVNTTPQDGDMAFVSFMPNGGSTTNVGWRYYWKGSWYSLNQDTVF